VKQRGENSQAFTALQPKELSQAGGLLWGIYCKLSPEFSIAELKAYLDLTGYDLSPGQVDLICDIHKASYK